MRFVFMNGGLGNQVFQYFFLTWLETADQDLCVVDDSAFFGVGVPHNGYELERVFGIQVKRLSQYFDPAVWALMCEKREQGIGIAQQLKDGGLPIAVVREHGVDNIRFDGDMQEIDADWPSLPVGNVYYHGYWLGRKFFACNEKKLRERLSFSMQMDARGQEYAEAIRRSTSVAIHIRRGDMAKLGWSSDPEYFSKAIRSLQLRVPKAHYFLFSDDLDWCHAHSDALGLSYVTSCLTCIVGNTGVDSWRDLQLMAMCQHMVADRSSFSLLAGMLQEKAHSIRLSRWPQDYWGEG